MWVKMYFTPGCIHAGRGRIWVYPFNPKPGKERNVLEIVLKSFPRRSTSVSIRMGIVGLEEHHEGLQYQTIVGLVQNLTISIIFIFVPWK